MLKRRRLEAGQQVIIIYIKEVGFVEHVADFINYRPINIGDIKHETPFFACNNFEISGLECFWLLKSDVQDSSSVKKYQRKIVNIQTKAYETSSLLGYTMVEKVKDHKIKELADQNVESMKSIIKKFGFNPTDVTHLLIKLSTSDLERFWFEFEETSSIVHTHDWNSVIDAFNQRYKKNITVEQAKDFSKKRTRYILGSYSVRMSGNSNFDDWVQAAKDFESHHSGVDSRMDLWSTNHQPNFPEVRTKEITPFWPGPYFNECIENIPELFTDKFCRFLKKDTALRVISYDSKEKFIRLDFLPEVRKLLKPNESENFKIWKKDRADYDIWIHPTEINKYLEVIDNLDD